jgi:glycosyltransferase involved in cell wall biosynthesis
MSVLFLGPLPDPITGHSLACKVFFDALVKQQRVELVNLNKRELTTGVSSVSRVFEVMGLVVQIWLKRKTCDVIYFTTSESLAGNFKDLLIYSACIGQLSRMVVHLHGGAGMRRIMLEGSGLLRRLNSFFLRRLGGAIVLGPKHVETFAGTVPRERIYVVPNFAEDLFFSDPDSIDRKFAQTAPLRVLFLSNFLPGKGHIELLDAFFALDEQARSALAIDFAGSFDSKSEKLRFLRRIEGRPQLRYHGVVAGERKRALLLDAHVLCLPTYYAYEGQPISILEGYASGCAVITTDHSGICDIFADRENGYEVRPRSADSLRAALEKALAQPELLHGFGRQNYFVATERYRASRYTRDLIEISQKIARQNQQ